MPQGWRDQVVLDFSVDASWTEASERTWMIGQDGGGAGERISWGTGDWFIAGSTESHHSPSFQQHHRQQMGIIVLINYELKLPLFPNFA